MQIRAINESPKKKLKKKIYKIPPPRNSITAIRTVSSSSCSAHIPSFILETCSSVGKTWGRGPRAGLEPARGQGVLQMDGLPGRTRARGQRPGGSPWLWTLQRLSPIFAGLQFLIRKGGLQKGPFQHSTAGLFAFSAIFWSTAGLSVLWVSNRKRKDRRKQKAAKQEPGCCFFFFSWLAKGFISQFSISLNYTKKNLIKAYQITINFIYCLSEASV